MEGRGHGPNAGRRDQKGDGKDHDSQSLHQTLRQHKQVFYVTPLPNVSVLYR